jgi:predicted dehydrogenase
VNHPDFQVVAVCDVDRKFLENARERAGLAESDAYGDFREVLARDDVDAVLIATPDHWHVPMSIAAAEAGKDVYCEKPLTLTVAEGRALVEAVRRCGVVLQTGSQQRSGLRFRQACELVRSGRIGQLRTILVELPGNNREDPGPWTPEEPPPHFDYDMWLGPAPWAGYTPARCHYNFRFIRDYSGGQITNWGAHHLDIAQWGNDTELSGPVRIEGRGEFPTDTYLFNVVTRVDFECEYANGVKLVCRTGGNGLWFEGDEGRIYVDRSRITSEPGTILDTPIGPNDVHLYESRDHKLNFYECCRTRRDPVADVEIGHRSATLCHIANISMLLKRPLRWDAEHERFVDDDEANRHLSRPMRAPWHV